MLYEKKSSEHKEKKVKMQGTGLFGLESWTEEQQMFMYGKPDGGRRVLVQIPQRCQMPYKNQTNT